ncbi:mechanosensitive ion channel family protein [Larsenimonas rhizosphaerae]|uniref:mechanosensitive ion channel family protein n=1 Tax=Larsenimonas rhizosphaerae TaxID=2944682 RepID=UPI0020333A49|nr:mechanosensitive ion channel domain-containing protein [Larsenimonas rhizosphaerae]MCM2130065.1 mechanosensitive ion channel family protein [Larsenimonas rhizosphaerae]
MTMKQSWQGWRVMVAVVLSIGLGLGVAQAEETKNQEGLWYSTESMNTGLPGEMDEAMLRTPREAMRSFTELTDKGDFEGAAHILNLTDLSPTEQRERGAMLARKLSEVFRRGKWLNISSLSGRRDAVIEDASGKDSRAGEPRRDIELVSMEVGSDAYDIRLGRYRISDHEPVWMITPESVRAIPALYDRYGPSRFEHYIPDRLKTPMGVLKLWEWFAIPLVLLMLWLIGKAVHALIGFMARWLPSGSPSIFVIQIQGPVAMIVVALVTQMLIEYVVSFSAIFATTLRVALITVMAWSAGAIALTLVDTFMLHLTRHMVGQIDDAKPRDDRKLLTTLYALRRVIILVLVISVTIYVLSQVKLFETLGMSILASASVLAVLVGVAGQAVLGNILSSFQLSLAKPVRIGDLVMFEGQWCYVEGIFYTYIRLRVWNERLLIVPVTYFASKAFENLSAGNTREYRSMELNVHLNADIAVLREKFLEFAQEEDDVIEHHKLLCSVTAQTISAQTLTCFLMASDPISGWRAEANIRERMLAFIRDHHPDWWPRNVMVISQQDITRGDADAP